METDFIHSAVPPWLHSVASDISTANDFAWKLNRDNKAGLRVTILRGNKMRNWNTLFDEFAAALQFPYYFGENLNAFDECITDLEWLDAEGYLLLVLRSDEVLIEANELELCALVRHLNMAASKWAKPVKEGEAWDRNARPFHVLFHTEYSMAKLLHDRLGTIELDVINITSA